MLALTTHNGTQQQISFNDLLWQARYTVVYFYPKDNTPGCTVEAKDFSERISSFSAFDAQVVWVSRDNHDSHCSFVQDHALQFHLISDSELILHKKYGARWEKNNYGKMVTWVIRSTVILDDTWNIIHERHNVRAKGHAQRVLDWFESNKEMLMKNK